MNQLAGKPPSGRKPGKKRREGSAGRRATDPPSNSRNRPDSPAAGRSSSSTADTRRRGSDADDYDVDDAARRRRDADPSPLQGRVGDNPTTTVSTRPFLPPSPSTSSTRRAFSAGGLESVPPATDSAAKEGGETATVDACKQLKKKKFKLKLPSLPSLPSFHLPHRTSRLGKVSMEAWQAAASSPGRDATLVGTSKGDDAALHSPDVARDFPRPLPPRPYRPPRPPLPICLQGQRAFGDSESSKVVELFQYIIML